MAVYTPALASSNNEALEEVESKANANRWCNEYFTNELFVQNLFLPDMVSTKYRPNGKKDFMIKSNT